MVVIPYHPLTESTAGKFAMAYFISRGYSSYSPFRTGQHVDEQLNEAEDEEVLSESDTDSEDETSRS